MQRSDHRERRGRLPVEAPPHPLPGPGPQPHRPHEAPDPQAPQRLGPALPDLVQRRVVPGRQVEAAGDPLVVGDHRPHLRLAPRAPEGGSARPAPDCRQPLRRRDRLRAYRDGSHVAVHLSDAHPRSTRRLGPKKVQQLLDLLEAVQHPPETPSLEDRGPCRPCAICARGTSHYRHRRPVLPSLTARRRSGGHATGAAVPEREHRPGDDISTRAALVAGRRAADPVSACRWLTGSALIW